MMLKLIRYKGGREKPFTVKCPSDARYPVEPEANRVITVEEVDALYLLDSQSELWEPADISLPPISPAEVPSKSKEKKA